MIIILLISLFMFLTLILFSLILVKASCCQHHFFQELGVGSPCMQAKTHQMVLAPRVCKRCIHHVYVNLRRSFRPQYISEGSRQEGHPNGLFLPGQSFLN